MDLKKPRMGARGQAALEYLMTYGWAILVILVVGLVLWQMGVFNQSSTPQGSSGFSQLIVLDSKYSGTDLLIIFSNEAGTKLDITDIVGDGCNLGYACVECASPIRPGQAATVTLTCPDKNAGEYYRVNVQVDYTNSLSGIAHSSTGDVWGTTE